MISWLQRKKDIMHQYRVPIANVESDTSSESISKRHDRSSELAKPSHRRVVCFSSTLPLQLLHFPFRDVTLSRLKIFSFFRMALNKRSVANKTRSLLYLSKYFIIIISISWQITINKEFFI